MTAIDTSIIISTYNAIDWLEKTLYGYNNQTYQHFEIVIADDGSDPETKALLDRIRKEVFYPIIHVWHEDNGFQKSQILNKAVLKCSTPYIVMSDGDCIPRKDFIEQHVKYREEGYFLSGGYFMLPIDISEKITKEDIYAENCFDLNWLKENGLKTSFKNKKLTAKPVTASVLNLITPTNASWNGHNASGWTKDIIAVNGLNEEMQYGGQDRELGERLYNLGIQSKQIRYNAIVVHLDHPRGYKNEASIKKNQAIRKETRELEKKWTEQGIVKNAEINPPVSIIVSTYNQPKWLQKALWGFEQQQVKGFELVIADDGSSQETRQLIEDFKQKSSLKIIHVWQEDHGFQKTKILNKAISASNGEYLIFTDGDCIPREDFIFKHLKYRKKGNFLSGGYYKLNKEISNAVAKEDIENQACFDADWLLEHGQKKNFKLNKLTSHGAKEVLLNTITPTSPTWDGNNASGWLEDIVAVNGFDERMQYGGEDRELGERLTNNNVQGIQIRYSAVTVHLDHERGYVTEKMIAKNKAIRAITQSENKVWTDFGIVGGVK
jgi:glycosyltransferase involved in cell wall biosynthesis